MTARSWLDKLETWIVVTLITVLVWLYAEGAIVERHPNERVTVRFTAAGGVPMEIEPEVQPVLVTFRSSGPVFQRFQAMTMNQTIAVDLEANVGESAGTPQVVDLRSRLEATLFTPLGVVIDEMDPALVEVSARRLLQRTVPVVVRSGGLDLLSPATVDPSSVVVTLPEDLALRLDAMLAADPSSVSAAVDLARKVGENPPPPGEPDVVSVAIVPPVIDGQSVPGLATREADVSYTLAKREGRLTLTSIPLRRLTPFQFPFEIAVANNTKVLNDVTLIGPVEALTRIESGQVPVWAELHFFDATQLTAGPMTVPVVLRLPAGVTSTSLPQLNVELRLRDVPTASGVQGPVE